MCSFCVLIHKKKKKNCVIILKFKFQGKGRNSDDGWGTPWGNWGTTLISAASTFTQEVGRGVGNIMDTVEGSLGVPDPETMAREVAKREREVKGNSKAQEQQADDSKASKMQTTAATEGKLQCFGCVPY